jgi:hypothetical protein
LPARLLRFEPRIDQAGHNGMIASVQGWRLSEDVRR